MPALKENATIENRCYAEIAIGDTASVTRTVTQQDIELFAVVSGDVNPAHLDVEYAEAGMFHKVIAHGMWGGALISAVLGTTLPGPGTIYLGQELRFRRPVGIGDTITATVTATEKSDDKHTIRFACVCTNQDGTEVITGNANVIAPTDKICRPRPILPDVHVNRHEWRQALLASVAEGKAVPTAVVHPCDANSLSAAIEAAAAGLIEPILVGPEEKIHAAARAAGLDIAAFRLVDAPHSHASAALAVALVRSGEARLLMKGSLHTDEMMHAVVDAELGLRTARRLSHVYVLNVPAYPRPLLITDAAINIVPTVEEKRDIVQNAIDLALIMGITLPKVALLAAVETVNTKMRSTMDAALLCKMADRGQITGGVLDGPLAFDNAISIEAANGKGITSPVAGRADIVVAPDLEAGNMLAKQLIYLGGADAAGIVLGARVPIILTSRSDDERTRIASCALAVLIDRHAENVLQKTAVPARGSASHVT
ncbi:MAG: Phosphate acetyltransferase [Rhodocyclales bacterium]|nr:Phosphate acetyltransferase [Rhodocyclales bacterium]